MNARALDAVKALETSKRSSSSPSLRSSVFFFALFVVLFAVALHTGEEGHSRLWYVLSLIPLVLGSRGLWSILEPRQPRAEEPREDKEEKKVITASPKGTPGLRISGATSSAQPTASPLSFLSKAPASSAGTPVQPSYSFTSTSTPQQSSTPKLAVSASPIILTQRTSFIKSIESPSLSGRKINNSISMSQYIDSAKKHEELKNTVNNSPVITPDPSRSSLFNRNSPYRYTAIPIVGDSKLAQGQDKILLNEQEAGKLYSSLSVDHVLDKWVDQLRLWFAHVLLLPLVDEMKFIETKFGSKLEKMVVQQQDPSKQAQNNATSMLNWSSKPVAQSGFSGFNFDISSFAPTAAQQNDPMHMELLKARLHLERFLHIPNATGTRDYVINRIRELAQGSVLKNFTWSDEKEKKETTSEWAVEEPSDAQILMHLFCTFMDDKLLPNDPAHKDQPFTARHFIQGALLEKELAAGPIAKSWPLIVLVSSRPPHYNLRMGADPKPGPSGEWCIKKGRINVFHALILFVFYIKQKMNGHLHELDLGIKYVQLLNVVD